MNCKFQYQIGIVFSNACNCKYFDLPFEKITIFMMSERSKKASSRQLKHYLVKPVNKKAHEDRPFHS